MAEYRQISISEVVVPEHRRQTDPEKVAALAASILETGLLCPIGLTCERKLIHGRHRLEAFMRLGREEIPAFIHEVDDLHAELAEIDENLQRSQLNPMDEFEALRRRQEIYEEIHPETRQYKAGGHAKHGSASDKMSFAEDTAWKTGKSRRTIERSVATARRLSDHIQNLIRGTTIARNKSQLGKLARLPAEQQYEVAHKLVSGEASTVDQALSNAPSKHADDAVTAGPSVDAQSPDCGHHGIDPEVGARMRRHEPGVIPAPSEVGKPVNGSIEEQADAEAKGEERSDSGPEYRKSVSLDQFLETLERSILQHTNSWCSSHPDCPWPQLADHIERLVKRICKNLRT